MEPEQFLDEGLRRAGIKSAATYSTGQVARILGVSPETVRRLVDAYEPPSARAGPRYPSGMRAIRIVSHRRVPHEALVEWLRANTAYLRLCGPGSA